MKRKIDLESLPLKDWKKEATMFQDDYTAGAGTSWLLNVAKAENEMIWEMIRAIEEAPTLTPQNEWVSVEDRLPNDKQIVLFHQKDGFIYCAEYFAGNSLCSPSWFIDTDCWEASGVTHWMPLPERPKEDG